MQNRIEVPLLPTSGNADGPFRTPPFLFVKGSESAFASEAQVKLCQPIAGSPFLSKLIPLSAEAKAAAKKRPKLADVGDEPDPKKAKAKAKGKAKAAKPKAGKQNPDADLAETKDSVEGLEVDMVFSNGSSDEKGRRPRRWLDDLLSAVSKAYGKPLSLDAHPIVPAVISLGLEFALLAKLSAGKKKFKDWSKAGGGICFNRKKSWSPDS